MTTSFSLSKTDPVRLTGLSLCGLFESIEDARGGPMILEFMSGIFHFAVRTPAAEQAILDDSSLYCVGVLEQIRYWEVDARCEVVQFPNNTVQVRYDALSQSGEMIGVAS